MTGADATKPAAIRRSRFRSRDLISESVTALAARPARAALTAMGTVLGVGALVAVLGLTDTASGQIGARFDALADTTVTVLDARTDLSAPLPFPDDPDRRASRLNGVTASGLTWSVPTGEDRPRATAVGEDESPMPLDVIAATPGLWRVAGPHLSKGRLFDEFHQRGAERVVVLGSGAARSLGISSLATRPAIFIGDTPFVVAGIIDRTNDMPELLLGVIIPTRTATALWGIPDPKTQAKMLVRTQLGAARQVAGEIAVALQPGDPTQLAVSAPPDPRSLRDNIDTDLAALFLVLAGVCLLIGAVGIANTTLVAVLERTGEIGLRRSLGARRVHIGGQIVAESACLGAAGGLVGMSIGLLAVVGVALLHEWTPIVAPLLLVAAPAIGLVIGMAAGLYPAARAARVEPSEALRR